MSHPTPEIAILRVRVSLAFARDELTTAVEQGIYYWAHVLRIRRDAEHYIVSAEIEDLEGARDDDPRPRRYTVTLAKMQRAIARLICDPHGTHSAGITQQLVPHVNPDAATADCAFQVACFGDVLYG